MVDLGCPVNIEKGVKLVAVIPEDLSAIEAAMDADGHGCPGGVTHGLWDDAGRLHGAVSLTYAPVVFVWMDTHRHSPLGCARAFRLVEQEVRRLGHPRMLLPIQTESPFHQYIGSLGYELVGPCELWQTK